MSARRDIDDFLRAEIAVGTFPSAVYLVGDSRSVRWQGAHGHAVTVPARIAASRSTMYDIASLTKPLITTPIALRVLAANGIAIETPVSRHVEHLRGTDKEAITFEQLLTHSSGLEAWWPLYASGDDSDSYLAAIVARPLSYPGGTRVVYSDLGFILLHIAIERIAGLPAREMAHEILLGPLALRGATFDPSPWRKGSIAATEWGQRIERRMAAEKGVMFKGFRDYLLWGEVNDGNAWGMGGYAGHAGLFATVDDIYTLGRSWIDRRERLLSNDAIGRGTRNYTAGLEENRGLGWQLRTLTGTAISAPFGERAFGHTGFTGTSVWIDPDRDLIAILLTNRIHPTAGSVGMQAARREFHRIVVENW